MNPFGPGVRRIARHLGWLQSQGIGRLVEEDELNPVPRLKETLRRWRWARAHPIPPGTASPVFVLGLQRSGTNMVVRAFRNSPKFRVFNENDRRAFSGFRLRSDDMVRRLIAASRIDWVLFKPLCDSHRALELLDLGAQSPARALWVVRDVDGRARSALAKFGDSNLQALRAVASGRGEGMWQAGGLSPANRRLVESFDYSVMTAADAAALFWFVRNSLFFELGLDRRPDVLAVSYERLVAAPKEATRRICEFVGCPWEPAMSARIAARDTDKGPLDIDPRIRELCRGLQVRFDAVTGDEAAFRAPSEEGL